MKDILAGIILCLLVGACTKTNPVIYQSESFVVYTDSVVQGENKALALSPKHMSSNYKSPASERYSRLISFKLSINEKDNERPSGIDHQILIGDEHESPLITFGEVNSINHTSEPGYLSTNYPYTFRIDMSPVLKQFEEQGYYEAFDGSRIARDDFKGFYIAGNAEPLTWDFVNLSNKGLKLKQSNTPYIYEIQLLLNPYDSNEAKEREWKLSKDIKDKPKYVSEQPIVDALYNLSLEEAKLNIESDSTLRTGAKWGGVWTRDVSYSTLLAFAYHEPEIAKISLLKKVKRGRIVQDTGSGGAWPVSSDRMTWALAAWEIYKVTGDREWLRQAFEIIKNSAEDDQKTLGGTVSGLYKGESSFLDWREQTYPKWMSNADIYNSENLGTNAVHYRAHVILAKMAKELNEPHEEFLNTAHQIKQAVNQYLWLDEKGYYAQYRYGRHHMIKSERFEALGEALTILFDIASEEKATEIISKSPLTTFGVTCIYPQIPGIPPYHNNGIWPFVQAFWNLAAAKSGNEKVLEHGLASVYRAGALFLTNYENFVAGTGDFKGTEVNSHRMLWSMAGNIAMVHRVFIGMQFEADGILFAPVIPKNYGGERTLSNFRYREAVFDITVRGHGNIVKRMTLNGNQLDRPWVGAALKGQHHIVIQMSNNDLSTQDINLVPNRFSLAQPQVNIVDQKLTWEKIAGAVEYKVYQNGELWLSTKKTAIALPKYIAYQEYAVLAIDEFDQVSFMSEPVMTYPKENEIIIQAEDHQIKSSKNYINYSGNGFVELTTKLNKQLGLTVQCDSGNYLLDIRYSNGSGPWNTDNNCAIRSLYVNSAYQGVIVFPQRGLNEWSDWGFSNQMNVNLKSGLNKIQLILEEWNINMDGEINDAMIDYVRLIKL